MSRYKILPLGIFMKTRCHPNKLEHFSEHFANTHAHEPHASPWISCQCIFWVLASIGSNVQSKAFRIKSIHRGKHGLSKRKYDNLHFHKMIWYIKELISNASIKTTIMKIPGDKWFPHPTLLVAYLQSSSFTSVFKNNLSMKEGCLFCLSLEISQIMAALATLLVQLESLND
jgi:hypothetical protein